MSDPLGLFEQDDPLELFKENKGAQAPSVSIPGAEQYDEEQRKRKAILDARTPEQRTIDGLKKWGEQGLGLAEAGYGFAHNTLGYLASIPVSAFTIAGKKLKPQDWSKEFFDNVQAMSYVPKTDAGEKRTEDLGIALQPFGLSPYTQIGPLSARASAIAKKGKAPKAPTMEERLAETRKTTEKPVEQPKTEQQPIVVDSAGNAMRPEDLIWRDRAQQQQIDALRPIDDEQARLLEQAIGENAQRSVERRLAELEDAVRLAAGRNRLEQNNASKLEAQPTGYPEWVEGQRQAANTRLPGNNEPMDLGPARLTRAGQYPDINDFPNILQDAPYQYEGALDPGINAQRALPIEVADMLRTGDRIPDPFDRVSTRQNANRMAQPLEDHIAALQRSEALPEDIARFEGEGGVNSGMSRGQRGAINMDIFEPFFRREKDLPNGVRLIFQGDTESPTIHAYKNDRPVGILKLESDKWVAPSENDNLRAQWVDTSNAPVSNLAPEMYKFAAEIGNDIVPSKTQTADGKAMWQRFEQRGIASQGMIRGQRGGIDLEALGFKSNDDASKLVKDLMGKKFFAETPKPENVIADAIKDGKDSSQSILFSAGATLQALKTKSPLIQGAARIVQGHKNKADNTIRETVFPVEEAFRGLSKKEVEDLATVFKTEMFDRVKLSPEQVNSLGMSDKQLIAYQRLRDMLRSAYEDQNNARIAAGKEAISEAEYYMSSRWQGDFRIPLKNDKGQLMWYVAADNKWAANKHADAIAKQFGLTKGEMSTVKSSRRGSNPTEVYTAMLDVLGRDNSMVKEIRNWIEQDTSEAAAQVRGQLKHFEPKSNTRGFIGDRPYKSKSSEALDLIQSQINYAKNAHYWAEMQRAGADVKKILADETLNQTQPKNMQYVREYWMDQIGFNESKVIKAIEDQMRSLGVSPNQIGRGISNIKNLWVTQKLALNLGFMASNVMQFGATFPHLIDLQKQYGGNPVTSLINGMLTGSMMATGHKTQQNPKFYKAVAMSPGDNKFLLEAMRYAEDNSVIARSIYDESPIASSFSPYASAMNFASKTITLPETYLRSIVYMTYANQIKSSGKFKNNMEIFREAEERTNASMGDYREGERALVFSKLGQIGNAANTLQTFPLNYYNQWSWAAREAGRGNVLPAVTMFAVQAYLAGMMGIPLMSEIDRGWEKLKDWLSEAYPQAWAKVKDFNLKEMALSLPYGEEILYGKASTDTGLGLTSRASAPVPSEMVQTPFAPVVDLFDQGADVGKAILDPLDEQKRAQAAMSISPSGLQGFLETGPLKDQVAGQFNEATGTTTYGKIKDMAAREATVERTPREEDIRKYGFRAQSEVVRKDLEYITGKRAAQTRNVLRELPNSIYNEARKGDKEKVKELMQLYVNGLGGNSQELKAALTRQINEELFTPSKRSMVVKKPSIQAVQQYKILQDTLKELGYAE